MTVMVNPNFTVREGSLFFLFVFFTFFVHFIKETILVSNKVHW